MGFQAMLSNVSGGNNTAFGYWAARGSTASFNTAVGNEALWSTTSGGSNTAVGYQALQRNTTAVGSTAVGAGALGNSTTGQYNTGIGINALSGVSTGSGNTMINPASSTSSSAPVFNPTTENNRFVLGSTAVTNAYIQVALTVVSDLRDKVVLGDVPHGLDFVSKLKPIKYQFKENRESNVAHGPIKYGFGAQDVLAEEGDAPVIVDTEVADKLKITDSHLIPVLVKAIQELKAEVDSLKMQLKSGV
jgi:hypothetical protein